MRWAKQSAFALSLLAAAATSGCGSDEGNGEGLSDRLVDFSKKPPYVNSLELDPSGSEFLLTTNRGFFRIDPETDEVERQRGTVTAEGETSTVGTFLVVKYAASGELIGSGHPDQRTLPSYLGFLRSDNKGES